MVKVFLEVLDDRGKVYKKYPVSVWNIPTEPGGGVTIFMCDEKLVKKLGGSAQINLTDRQLKASVLGLYEK